MPQFPFRRRRSPLRLEQLENRITPTAPAAPQIINPLENETTSYFSMRLEISSTFFDADGDTHAATNWEIRDSTNGGAVVWQAPNRTDPTGQVHVSFSDGTFVGVLAGQTQLAASHLYQLAVSVVDSRGEVSADSIADFQTNSAQTPVPGVGDWLVRQGYVVEAVGQSGNYRLPVKIAFVPNPGNSPDSPLFYVTELYGSIKVVTRSGAVSTYASSLLDYNPDGPIAGTGEQGLTGILVDPASGDLFVSMLWDNGVPSLYEDHFPKIERLHSNDGGLTMASRQVILNMQPERQGQAHQISEITFGPDGKLYVDNGDGFDSTNGLDLNRFRGKILRLNTDGTAPTDNPFYNAADGITATDYIYSYGHRNPFAAVWRASTGTLYVGETGNTIDHVESVYSGKNMGYDGTDASMAPNTLYDWNSTAIPTGVAFIQGQTFGGSLFPTTTQDHLFVGLFGPTYGGGPQESGKRIDEFNPDSFDANGKLTVPTTLVKYNGTGRYTIGGIAAGPDGLYFTTIFADSAANGPTATGASVFRVRYVGFQPTAISAIALNSSVRLNWTSDPLAASHNVYRLDGTTETLIAANVVGSTYTVTGLTNGTQYSFFVRGVNAGGESQSSAIISATPQSTASDQPPFIVNAAAAGSATVAGTSVTLSALGGDDQGEVNLRYVWSVVAKPAGAADPTFSANGTNPSKNTTATISSFGAYTFRVTILDGSNQAITSDVTVTFSDPSPPPAPGLTAEFFVNPPDLTDLPDLTGRTPDFTRIESTVNYPQSYDANQPPWPGLDARFTDNFSARLSGFVKIDTAGTYTFSLLADDGARLWIDNVLVVDNGGRHAPLELSGSVTLTAGYHALRIEYFEWVGNQTLQMYWEGPGIAMQVVPASVLFQTSGSVQPPANQSPTIVNAAAANPTSTTATSVNLSALGADDGGEANLIYRWATVAKPAGAADPTFSASDTNAAKNTTVTVSAIGTYTFRVTILDAQGQSVTSSVTVTFNAIPTGPQPGLQSEFFVNPPDLLDLPDLTGRTPDVVRTDTNVNFPITYDGNQPPWPGLDSRFADNYSLRMTGFLKVDIAGDYTFSLFADDGARLWVDGQLVVDNGGRHAPTEKIGTTTLTAGYHAIRIEYFEWVGAQTLQMFWAGPGITKQLVPPSAFFLTDGTITPPANQPPTIASPATANPNPVSATSTNLSVLGADDAGEANLIYRWATVTKPAGAADPTFSASDSNAAKNVTVTVSATGTYTFRATVLDAQGQSATSTVDVTFTAVPTGPQAGLVAEYFVNPPDLTDLPDLTGRTADFTKVETTINFPLSFAANQPPWPGLDTRFADNYSARFTGFVRVDTAGTYTFSLLADDGARLWIDNVLVVDNGGRHAPVELTGAATLTTGYHAIRIEYFEWVGNQTLQLSWEGPGIGKQIVPATNLFQTNA